MNTLNTPVRTSRSHVPNRKTATLAVSARECANQVLETVPSLMEMLRVASKVNLGDQMSLAQLRCLGVIDRNPGLGVAAVAARLGVATPTTSAMVERMVRAGAVQTFADPADRRRSQLFVTDVGHAQLLLLRTNARDDVTKALSGSSLQELQTIQEGLTLLKQKIQQGISK